MRTIARVSWRFSITDEQSPTVHWHRRTIMARLFGIMHIHWMLFQWFEQYTWLMRRRDTKEKGQTNLCDDYEISLFVLCPETRVSGLTTTRLTQLRIPLIHYTRLRTVWAFKKSFTVSFNVSQINVFIITMLQVPGFFLSSRMRETDTIFASKYFILLTAWRTLNKYKFG